MIRSSDQVQEERESAFYLNGRGKPVGPCCSNPLCSVGRMISSPLVVVDTINSLVLPFRISQSMSIYLVTGNL